MTNRVHVQHVLKFLRCNLQIAEQNLAAEKAKYNQAKLEYELKQQCSKLQKFLRKLGFKPTPFERSSEGTLDWISTQWDDYLVAERRVRKFKRELQAAEYHYKCRDVTMEWTFTTGIEHFYAYCQLNSIPY